MNWLKNLPWRRIEAVALGSGVLALGVAFPMVSPLTSIVGSGLIGSALPSEWTGGIVSGVVKVAAKVLKRS